MKCVYSPCLPARPSAAFFSFFFPPSLYFFFPFLSCGLLSGFCSGLIWSRPLGWVSSVPLDLWRLRSFGSLKRVTDRDPGLQPQAAENEREEKSRVQRRGEGRLSWRGGPPASHPLHFYWLPLKHLQYRVGGGPWAPLTLIHSENTLKHSVNILPPLKCLQNPCLLFFHLLLPSLLQLSRSDKSCSA